MTPIYYFVFQVWHRRLRLDWSTIAYLLRRKLRSETWTGCSCIDRIRKGRSNSWVWIFQHWWPLVIISALIAAWNLSLLLIIGIESMIAAFHFVLIDCWCAKLAVINVCLITRIYIISHGNIMTRCMSLSWLDGLVKPYSSLPIFSINKLSPLRILFGPWIHQLNDIIDHCTLLLSLGENPIRNRWFLYLI